MVGQLLAVLGVILVILAVLKYVGLVALGGAAAGTLLVVGIVLLVIAYFVFNRGRSVL